MLVAVRTHNNKQSARAGATYRRFHMLVSSAVDLIGALIYKPGWVINATPHTNRFEGTVSLNVTYPALDSGSNSNPETWRDGYSVEVQGGARASFPIIVEDADDTELYRRVLNVILDIEQHEAREFLRVLPTGWAPFHPHRIDGMKRWGNVEHDLQFGLS